MARASSGAVSASRGRVARVAIAIVHRYREHGRERALHAGGILARQVAGEARAVEGRANRGTQRRVGCRQAHHLREERHEPLGVAPARDLHVLHHLQDEAPRQVIDHL
jgi:hypothetical protein